MGPTRIEAAVRSAVPRFSWPRIIGRSRAVRVSGSTCPMEQTRPSVYGTLKNSASDMRV